VSRTGALDRIDTLLGTVSSPTFDYVVRGEPFSISATPVVAFWLISRNIAFETLTDVSTTTDFLIRAYWRIQASQDMREDIELDVWNASVNIPSALRGDSTLNGNVADLSIGSATTGYTEIGGLAFRTLDVPLTIEIMGEVAIAP